MLDYDEFKKEVIRSFMGFMGKSYDDYELTTMPVTKRGRKLDAFSLKRKDGGTDEHGNSIMPTLYFNDMYRSYLESDDISYEIEKCADAMKRGLRQGKRILSGFDLKKSKKNIVFQLVNREEYSQVLEDIPYREFLDMCVVYRWAIHVDDTGLSSALIDNDLAERLGYDEEDLFTLAYENTRKMFPPEVIHIDEIIDSIMRDDGAQEEDIENYRNSADESVKFWLLSNRIKHFGASGILYEEVLHDLSDDLDSDLLMVMPSTDEVIILKANENTDIGFLFYFAEEICNDHVNERERLSDGVYLYSRSSRRIFPMTREQRG